ncbi:hypothetical protein SAMN02745150_01281 [Brevinema andersonii]|uniref:Uncharacterized protein n=1 Tax=Brevinema andersonii TaxID=34097 RepID=A0A1I1EW95_BREAD|nr:hypothetical protein [Brevinema andersonii]SFB90976.1 hypothetical protein SAMN02745150_01281 [Brevinema andersonii]
MDIATRKKLWNIFYAEILADILITGQIVSPSLKKFIADQDINNIYATLLMDLKTFFDKADMKHVYNFFNTIMDETLSQEKIFHLMNSIA